MASVDKYGYVTLGDATETSSSSTNSNNYTSSITNMYRTGIMASKGMFWFLTIAMTLLLQVIIHHIWGAEISSWDSNMLFPLEFWGFTAWAIVGTFVYNICLCKDGKKYGYAWHHYVLSVLMSVVCAAAWIVIDFLITLILTLLIGALIIAFVVGLLNGG